MPKTTPSVPTLDLTDPTEATPLRDAEAADSYAIYDSLPIASFSPTERLLLDITTQAHSKDLSVKPKSYMFALVAALATGGSVASFPASGSAGAKYLPFAGDPTVSGISATFGNFILNFEFFVPFSETVYEGLKSFFRKICCCGAAPAGEEPEEPPESTGGISKLALGLSAMSTTPFLGLTHKEWAGKTTSGGYWFLMASAFATFTALHYSGGEALIDTVKYGARVTKEYFKGKSPETIRHERIARLRAAHLMLFENGFENTVKLLATDEASEDAERLKALLDQEKLSDDESEELLALIYRQIDDSTDFRFDERSDKSVLFTLKAFLLFLICYAVMGYEDAVETLMSEWTGVGKGGGLTAMSLFLMSPFYGLLGLVSSEKGAGAYELFAKYWYTDSWTETFSKFGGDLAGAAKDPKKWLQFGLQLFTYWSAATPLGLAAKLPYYNTFFQWVTVTGTMLFNIYPYPGLIKRGDKFLKRYKSDIETKRLLKLMNIGEQYSSTLRNTKKITPEQYLIFLRETQRDPEAGITSAGIIDLIKLHFETENLFPGEMGDLSDLLYFIDGEAEEDIFGYDDTVDVEPKGWCETISAGLSSCWTSFWGCCAGRSRDEGYEAIALDGPGA